MTLFFLTQLFPKHSTAKILVETAYNIMTHCVEGRCQVNTESLLLCTEEFNTNKVGYCTFL